MDRIDNPFYGTARLLNKARHGRMRYTPEYRSLLKKCRYLYEVDDLEHYWVTYYQAMQGPGKCDYWGNFPDDCLTILGTSEWHLADFYEGIPEGEGVRDDGIGFIDVEPDEPADPAADEQVESGTDNAITITDDTDTDTVEADTDDDDDVTVVVMMDEEEGDSPDESIVSELEESDEEEYVNPRDYFPNSGIKHNTPTYYQCIREYILDTQDHQCMYCFLRQQGLTSKQAAGDILHATGIRMNSVLDYWYDFGTDDELPQQVIDEQVSQVSEEIVPDTIPDGLYDNLLVVEGVA